VTSCVFDTDVVIAALDRADAHHRRAARAIRKLVEAVPSRELQAAVPAGHGRRAAGQTPPAGATAIAQMTAMAGECRLERS